MLRLLKKPFSEDVNMEELLGVERVESPSSSAAVTVEVVISSPSSSYYFFMCIFPFSLRSRLQQEVSGLSPAEVEQVSIMVQPMVIQGHIALILCNALHRIIHFDL